MKDNHREAASCLLAGEYAANPWHRERANDPADIALKYRAWQPDSHSIVAVFVQERASDFSDCKVLPYQCREGFEVLRAIGSKSGSLIHDCSFKEVPYESSVPCRAGT